MTVEAMPLDLVRRAAAEQLELARLACGAQFAVLRMRGREPIATDPAVPLDQEQRLALRAESSAEPAIVLGEQSLRETTPAARFYAAAKLIDSAGRSRGTLAVLDQRPLQWSNFRQTLLLGIASSLARLLETSEQNVLRPLIDGAPVAMFAYGIRSRRLIYVNAKFAETLGYTVDQVLALPSITDIIADEERGIVAEMIARREAGDDGERRYLLKMRCRDGTLLDAEIRGSVIEVDGEPVSVGAALDVTTQVAANRQLRDREEYFRALTDHLTDVIAIISREHVVTYVSPSIRHVLGHPPEQHLGRLVSETLQVHAEDRDRLGQALNELAAGERFGPAEFRFRHGGGRWRTMELAGTNLLEHEQIRGLAINLHDITERKRMEQELAQLHRLTSLGRLSAQIAHEFNNVMMGIQPIVEVIRRRAGDDPTLLRFTDVIAASLTRGKRITSDILRFGRPAQLSLRTVSVQELLWQAAEEIRPSLREGMTLRTESDAAPLFIRADPAQLAQVLVNLALNARDAMQDGGGTLTIAAGRARQGEIADAGSFVHLALSDTGAGIAPDDLPYIFEPLFTTKKSGTGLGLSVVFQIVAAHGGHISVDSEPGRGTTLHLFIPSAEAEPQAEPGESAQTGQASRPMRVLVVEDEETVASGLRWTLEAEGMAVRVVGRGADVLPAVDAFAPDVMLLELALPDEDGRSVYERVAARHPLPVIFSSGHATEAEIETLVDPSRAAFLMKPYAIDELLRALHRLVGRKEAD